jgi:nicotinate-nucleotide adenylyltransferase
LALRLLGLNQVWWLVSPQNPLKPRHGMAELADRLAKAAAIARDPRIKVSDLEARLGIAYTVDTIAQIRRRFPRWAFVWIMGADNLIQIPRWRRWKQIFHTIPVAVFARAPYSNKALAGLAARRFWRSRVDARHARRLTARTLPAWVFLHTSLSPESATAIRLAGARARLRGPVQPGSGARGLRA